MNWSQVWPELQQKFPSFYKQHTGGGCNAWKLELRDGDYMLVTGPPEGCSNIPEDDDTQVSVGVYTSDSGEEEWRFLGEINCVDLVDFVTDEVALERERPC